MTQTPWLHIVGIGEDGLAGLAPATRAVVEATLKDIETRGDAAVRDLSEKFDAYSPESFRLSQDEIDALIAQLSARELADIRFAQEQVVTDLCTVRVLDVDAHTPTKLG